MASSPMTLFIFSREANELNETNDKNSTFIQNVKKYICYFAVNFAQSLNLGN